MPPSPTDSEYIDSLRQDLRFEARLGRHELSFLTTWGLFSPRGIDEGTSLLIDHMRVEPTDTCLDLGCGYGPIGLWMACEAARGRAVLVDKDFVAVDYARRNAALNRIENVEVLLSNGFNQVPEGLLDLVATNLPAKSGKELYYLYFHDAWRRLRPGGRFYVVSINGLRRFIERSFKECFGNYDKLKQGRQYTVAMAVRQA